MIPRYLIAKSLLVAFAVTTPLLARDRGAARAAYQEARQYHDQLVDSEESGRNLKRYSRALFLYRTVIDHDPTYAACDDALYSMASLYEEMASRFQNDRYRRRAIYYYEFVAQQYPTTKHRKTALKQAALLEQKPKTEAATASRPAAPEGLESGQATLSEIRYWSSEDYTRVVLQLSQEVEFQREVLSEPARIYFDLKNARLNPNLLGKTYILDDLFIRQIRVGQNRPGVVRVVLDFVRINKHTVFALYDPFRIVIDTSGEQRSTRGELPRTERAPKTEEAVISLDAEPRREVITSATPVIPAPNMSGDLSLTRVLGLKVGRVVIDPGHGGKDTGTIGPDGLKEKDLVLAISLRLKQLLQERLGTDVVLTRDADKFVPLEERTAIANQLKADLFISIHANSSRSRKTTGVETFFLNFSSNQEEREIASRENAGSQKNIRDLENLLRQIALGDYNEESKDLAHVVQENLHSTLKSSRPRLRNRGVKKAPFIVLINLDMPGILTEVGFISNPSDEKYFRNEDGQNQAANAIYKGVEEYFRALGALPQDTKRSANTAP